MKPWLAPLLILLVLACGPRSEPSASPPPTGAGPEVTFMVFGDPAEKAAYEGVVAAFRQRRPDVAVKLVHIPSPGDYRRRLALDYAGGSPPDVSLMNYRRYLAFAAKDMLEPLDRYLADSQTLKAADLYPVALEPFTWQDRVWGLPQNVSSLVVYYNQDLFDKAGVPYPKAGWTWDDFLATARRLTLEPVKGQPRQYGLGVEPSLIRLAPFLWQNGGEIAVPHPDSERKLEFSWASTPLKLALDLPASREAFQWFVDLQRKHHVVPDRTEEKSQDSEARFMAGHTAMFLDSRRAVPSFREIQGFRWDVAPLPRRKKAATPLHSDAFFLAASSKNKPGAWAFIEFASGKEGQEILAGTGRTVPSNRSVAESPAFLASGKPPASSRVWLEVVPDIRPVPVMDTWDEVEEVADREIERAFYGDATVDEAVKAIQERGKEFFDRAITR